MREFWIEQDAPHACYWMPVPSSFTSSVRSRDYEFENFDITRIFIWSTLSSRLEKSENIWVLR